MTPELNLTLKEKGKKKSSKLPKLQPIFMSPDETGSHSVDDEGLGFGDIRTAATTKGSSGEQQTLSQTSVSVITPRMGDVKKEKVMMQLQYHHANDKMEEKKRDGYEDEEKRFSYGGKPGGGAAAPQPAHPIASTAKIASLDRRAQYSSITS
eukprot:CAMPEP_0172560384 /NCGR_PEP_ID=MMETSP1067-20121228/88493_1 /TAXON_ID=265564 ORGANISM="Thalassiosira punctigera, Strain Tpunct2005C2" /NCGR_SAMPLE_ID=MMETSP1067 /ASSEMBLY_ACC=CAM_ASM_000444 /LENGTH=151 /DNA_ID=CAMNT_0013350171 /DNA_START=27 /DNA_END=479 /DNA_ORIENTATION=-